MWFLAGSDVTFPIEYLLDGVPVVPDSAAYVLRGHTGVQISSGTMPAMLNNEPLVILAAQNAIANGELFENRFLTISFLHENATHQMQRRYQIHSFFPITGTTEGVRAELGLDTSELPDRDADLISAYIQLAAEYGVNFTAAVVATGVVNLAANQAVVVKAALNVADSLALRVGQTTRSEDHLFTRFANLDFEVLKNNLQAKLARLMNTATATVVSLTDGVTIFALSNPTDAVTNA